MDVQELFIAILCGIFVLAVGIILYRIRQSRQRQALDQMYTAIDALATVDLSLRRYVNENPGSNVIESDIIHSASKYLPREDVEFLNAVHMKSSDEIRQFITNRIHPQVFKLIDTRDKLQLKVHGSRGTIV
ncbi:hypothetical protein M3194_05205 [Paenibacillus glycanilyticus]|uniref:hypothetical protein n=1 Tax=Paenibacillus glycanilyticus TaxID=126569 RepID=UPI00203EAB4A|nr:hypothetical protein [Paenibacillus glycanilyticus]MCM3626756.1 hypothetical protein [Paenibacillus glycanilyticus]